MQPNFAYNFNHITHFSTLFQTSEVEAAALNQQKKIEELEAQLQEAEDIVKDLREELGEVQDKLERLKRNNLQNVNESNNDRSSEMPTTVYPYESSKFLQSNSRDEYAVASEITMSSPSQKNGCPKCYYSKKDCMCSSNIRNRNLPSIILRDNYKEPGLHRNGRTQRIRACEGNLLDKESCLPGETDSIKDKNGIEELEEGGYTGKAPSFGEKTLSELENKLLADIKLSSFQPFRRKRKRATKQRETVTCMTTKLTDPFQKPDQLPELSTGYVPVSVKENAHSSESPFPIASILSPDEAEKWTHQGCEESSGGRILQKDEGLKENMVPLGKETGFAESLLPPDCKVAVETDDMPSNSLDWSLSDSSKGLPNQPTRERIIKYTFQRKHKRGVSSGPEANVSTEMENRNEDKRNVPKNHEPSKASLSAESSRDSRRLAQVARQVSE